MGVNVGEIAAAQWIALILAVLLVGFTVYAARHGRIRDRTTKIVIAVLVGVLIVVGMSVGFVPAG